MDSSFDDDELIKELGDLGMVYAETNKKEGSNKKTDSSTPKQTKSNSNTKKETPRSGKKRPPSKIQINLDELMDGIEINPPNLSTNTKTQQPKSSSSPFLNQSNNNIFSSNLLTSKQPEKNVSIDQLESRLNSYLAMQIRTLINEFSVEIDKMFQENNEIDPIINKFCVDLRQQIRDSCNFDGVLSPFPTAASLLDSYSIGFTEAFKDAKSLQNYKPQEEIKRVKAAKAKFLPLPSVIRQTFSTATTELSTILGEREALAFQRPFYEQNYNLEQKYRELSLMRYELECKAQLQEEDSEIIQKKIAKIDEERTTFTENLDKTTEDSYNDIDLKIKQKLERINSTLRKLHPTSLMVNEKSVKSMIEENNSMRQIRDMNIQQVVSLVEESKSSSQFRNITYEREDNKPSLLYQSTSFPQNTTYLPITASNEDQSFGSNIATIGDQSPTTQLLNKVRNKLREVQSQRETELQNVTTFLSNMKRREKKRRRQRYGDESDI